jgi:C-terminal peptidase prc
VRQIALIARKTFDQSAKPTAELHGGPLFASLIRMRRVLSLFLCLILTAPATHAETAVKACAPTFLSPWELALHKHAMYSSLDGPMVLRALKHFMNRLDSFGTFFLEADHVYMKPREGELHNIRIQTDLQDYRRFQKILDRFRESVTRAKAFLEAVPNLRQQVIERAASPDLAAIRTKFDFLTPPKTIEEQNQKLIDYMAAIYFDHIHQGREPAEAYLLAVRSMKRDLDKFLEDASRPIHELALKSLMAGLDPHSTYMNKKEFEAFLAKMKTDYSGIGLRSTETSLGYSIEVIAGGPAAKAGLQDGDIITHIYSDTGQEISVRRQTKEFVSGLLKGPESSVVSVKVRRGKENLKISVTREALSTAPDLLKAGMSEGPDGEKLGIITLASFYDKADNHVAGTIKRMVEQGIDGLVFDLRGNPGGLLEVATNIMSLVQDGGPAYLLNKFKNDVGRKVETVMIPSGNVMFRGPIIIIIDEGSASASELMTMSLRDHNRVVVFGAPRSYGKATQQDTHAVIGPDEKPTGEAVKVTEAVFLGPRGISPNLTGIRPDIRSRENTLPIGVLADHPDTTMPNIYVPPRIPISRSADNERYKIVSELTRLYKERTSKEPADPSMTPYEKEQNDALLILVDYIKLLKPKP